MPSTLTSPQVPTKLCSIDTRTDAWCASARILGTVLAPDCRSCRPRANSCWQRQQRRRWWWSSQRTPSDKRAAANTVQIHSTADGRELGRRSAREQLRCSSASIHAPQQRSAAAIWHCRQRVVSSRAVSAQPALRAVRRRCNAAMMQRECIESAMTQLACHITVDAGVFTAAL